MPYKQVNVQADLFLEVGEVKLYYTYKNDNVEEGVLPYNLTTDNDANEFERTDYDFRVLLKERIESGRFPNKYVTLFGDEDEIREGLRAAILAGEITFPEESEESENEQPANRGDAEPVSLGSLLRQKLAMMEPEGLINLNLNHPQRETEAHFELPNYKATEPLNIKIPDHSGTFMKGDDDGSSK